MGVGLSSTARWFTQALITAPRRAALAIIGADQSIDQACLFKTQRHVVMDDDSTALSATLLRKLFYGWICSQKELQSASDANEPKGSLDVTVRPIVSL